MFSVSTGAVIMPGREVNEMLVHGTAPPQQSSSINYSIGLDRDK